MIGRTLSHYRILEELGSGGMGEVYRAEDLELGRHVAVKVLREDFASDPERLRRFEQEARSASALNHPNIITIHEIGKHGSTPYIVMELVEGKTLREMLAEGPLTTKELFQLASQTTEGLAKAHSAGIVHRDLKPENLMVTSEGYVKILDFGVVKLMPQICEIDSETPTLPKATRHGVLLGTVQYMSPEQAAGRPVDYRSDQFSLGAILYEMVTGERAFHRDSSVQTLSAIIEQEPESITSLNPNVPVHLRVIVERCLAKKPEDRYDSTRDLARELRSVAEELPRKPREGFGDSTTASSIESIAVLPLVDLRPQPGEEYFADGMTEALIAELAKMSALKVISRTSVMQYKGAKKPLPEIARELNVDAVLEGSVLRSGTRVRITAQLIHAATDIHLWTESYVRELEDVLDLQSDVARAVGKEIQIQLTPQEQERLSRARPVKTEAYEAYLKGRYHWSKRTGEGITKAIDHFEQAIKKDPSYAQAYAGLADSYSLLGVGYGELRPRDAFPRAKEAAEKALALDDTLAEAHTSLAHSMVVFDWDWSNAEREFELALALNPSYARAHEWYGHYLLGHRRFDEGYAQLKKAQELDPLSVAITCELGWYFYWTNQPDRALEKYEKALELDPYFAFVHYWVGLAYEQKAMFPEAIETLQKAVNLSGGSPPIVAALGHAYAVSGKPSEALELRDELVDLSKKGFVVSWDIANIHAGLDEKDVAVEWLERAYEEHHGLLMNIYVWPPFDNLRDEPRFQALIRRMNFVSGKRQETTGELVDDLERVRETSTVVSSSATRPEPSIAVLPFANMSADPEQDYFCEGMAEEIVHSLAQVKGLRVVARTSAFAFKGKHRDVRDIGRRLGAAAVLEGSVRKSGNHLRITSQLIDVVNGYHLWSERYDRKMEDLFATQDEIASIIAKKLEAELHVPASTYHPNNLDAHDAYLRGRFIWNQGSFENSIQFFEQAILRDPRYARAYLGLADAYFWLGFIELRAPKEAYPRAEEALSKVRELEPSLAEVHSMLGSIKFVFGWDWLEAEAELRHAIELNPNSASAHQQYASYLGNLGRLEETIAEFNLALELEPLEILWKADLGYFYFVAGRYNEAVDTLQETLELDPNHPFTRWVLATVYLQMGRYEKSIEEYRRAMSLSEDTPFLSAGLARAYAVTDRRDEAAKILRDLEELSKGRYVSSVSKAWIHIGLAEHDRAFQCLEKAYRERATMLINLPSLPWWDPLRPDPRFKDLLRRMNFPGMNR